MLNPGLAGGHGQGDGEHHLADPGRTEERDVGVGLDEGVGVLTCFGPGSASCAHQFWPTRGRVPG